jgi:hypothetical protein
MAYTQPGNTPLHKKEVKKVKAKGGGTKKVCLPKAKIASMSKEERQKVINAKRAAGAKGKYKRSSKSNVTGTSSGGDLKTWVKQDWRQVADPSKNAEKNEFIRHKTIRNERRDVRRNNIYTNRRQFENTTIGNNHWLHYI